MKLYQLVLTLFLAGLLSACGINPGQDFQEALAEQLIEESTGSSDVNIDIGEDSVSFSMEDEDGSTTGVSTALDENLEAVEAFGFVFTIPAGFTNSVVQRIDNGGTSQVTVKLDIVDATAEQFFAHTHAELAAVGFEFDDIFKTGADQPDPTADGFIPNVNYKHPDGQTVLIVWAEDKVIMTFKK